MYVLYKGIADEGGEREREGKRERRENGGRTEEEEDEAYVSNRRPSQLKHLADKYLTYYRDMKQVYVLPRT